MRLFIAIELPPDAREHLQRVQAVTLSAGGGSLHPVSSASMHLTLNFLGEIAESALPILVEALAQIRRRGPVLLQTQELELLPPQGDFRVVAASMGGDAAGLRGLHRAVEQQLARTGVPTEARGFRPHVTLARCRDGLPAEQRPRLVRPTLPLWPGPSFLATEFHLMQSELQPAGTVHRVMQTFAFAPAATS